jgi:hypothetical protein
MFDHEGARQANLIEAAKEAKDDAVAIEQICPETETCKTLVSENQFAQFPGYGGPFHGPHRLRIV